MHGECVRTSALFVLAGLAFPPNQHPANSLDNVHSRQLRPAAPVGAPLVAVVAAAAAASAVAVACPPRAAQSPSPHFLDMSASPTSALGLPLRSAARSSGCGALPTLPSLLMPLPLPTLLTLAPLTQLLH